ncbi:MAG: glutathione peroxidase [Phenylobacterium sp.]|uniref:glutathione peroxidase n=1 Tax=Phenylobacterium sp. TaxID=1871053 RepID=UPI0025D066B1|nr:glutathione peroxidase [Phenylobacterium sp.]MBI1196657.1 glutathione peroxidase [Phenylobacterium sp.]
MSSAYDYSFDKIDGGPLPMTTFKDKVVLVVNTASKCGLTPQYNGLETLYSDYKDKGLVVLGVPCNQFMGQEPGTEAEIQTFCSTTFGIDFPMTAKVEVKEAGRHPFYAWAEQELGEPAVPVWNFHKILVGKNGEALQAFGPRTEPQDEGLIKAIEAAL